MGVRIVFGFSAYRLVSIEELRPGELLCVVLLSLFGCLPVVLLKGLFFRFGIKTSYITFWGIVFRINWPLSGFMFLG